MGVAGKQRLMPKSSELFAGQFLVNLPDLRWEGIPTCPAFTDVARYLRIGF